MYYSTIFNIFSIIKILKLHFRISIFKNNLFNNYEVYIKKIKAYTLKYLIFINYQ